MRTQEYVRTRAGRRVAAHTPSLRGRCVCQSCALRRYWTPERRAERSDDLRRQYADGRRTIRRNPNEGRARVWGAEQDALLVTLVGRYDLATIARKLNEAGGYPRTPAAITHRIGHLGLSRMALRPFSSSEVGRLLGISRETVRTRLVARGLLVGQARTGGPHGMLLFERAELERLVTEHPEMMTPEQIKDAGLRALAVAATRGRRLVDSAEVMRLTGAEQRALCSWYTNGQVPSARKVRGRRGHAGGWLIEAGDLAVVRRLVAAAEAKRRQRAVTCEAGHPWAGPYHRDRRCPICRRARGTPVRCTVSIVDRAEALARVIGRVRVA